MDYDMLIGSTTTVGAVARWINSSQVQGDVPEIIVEAESWIYRRLRHWRMLTDPINGTIATGDDFVTSPTDLLEPFLLWTTGRFYQIIPMKPVQEVISNWQYTGNGSVRVQQQPMMYYQAETTLRFDSPANLDYDYNLVYFKQPEGLGPSNQTNFLTNIYPRLMRCALMAAASEFIKDNGQGAFDRTYWDQLAEVEIDKAQEESDRAKRATVAGMILIGGGVSSNYPMYVTGY